MQDNNNIILVSGEKSNNQGALQKAGFRIKEYHFPFDENTVKTIDENRNVFRFVVETDSLPLQDLEKILLSIKAKEKIICTGSSIAHDARQKLVNQGIADFFIKEANCELVEYLHELRMDEGPSNSEILIFEHDQARVSVLKSIISRFNYSPVFIDSCDEALTHCEKNSVQFILINLGIEYHELCSFIRNAYSNMEIKSIPVISYKDMNDGIYIHEIISGLNKLTKIILSVDELYGFLVDMFIKKELMPLVQRLNLSLNFSDFAFYTNESLKKIYYLCEGNMFDFKSSIDPDSISEMAAVLVSFKAALNRIQGFKWLLHKSRVSSSTCEVGV